MVDVDLCEGELPRGGVGLRERGEDGRDRAAGRAPVGVEVYDDMCGRLEEGVELGGGGDLVDFGRRLRDGTPVLEEGLGIWELASGWQAGIGGVTYIQKKEGNYGQKDIVYCAHGGVGL